MPTRFSQALLATPEMSSAMAALRDLLQAAIAGSLADLPNPLFIHGRAGAGKTSLVRACVHEMTAAGFEVCCLSANDFADLDDLNAARDADLLVVEDMQHLPIRFAASVIALVDHRANRAQPTIFTATEGPGALTHRGAPLPRRLTNRLAGGLVVKIEPIQERSRRRLLEKFATDAKLHVTPEVLDWLAKNLPGTARELQGAIGMLRMMQRGKKKPLQLAEIQAEMVGPSNVPTVERIAERVGVCFRVSSKQLMSARRSRQVVLPRQVTMYLARQLTTMSLEQIGKHMGRDHKTVRHACNKIETALKKDAALSSTVRQLSAELS